MIEQNWQQQKEQRREKTTKGIEQFRQAQRLIITMKGRIREYLVQMPGLFADWKCVNEPLIKWDAQESYVLDKWAQMAMDKCIDCAVETFVNRKADQTGRCAPAKG